VDQSIKTLQLISGLLQHQGDPAHIIAPGGLLISYHFSQAKHALARYVQGANTYRAVGTRARCDPGIAIDGHGHHIAHIVVGVTTHEVNPTRCLRPPGRRFAKIVDKSICHQRLALYLIHLITCKSVLSP